MKGQKKPKPSEKMKTITTPSGRSYQLTNDAILELLVAEDAYDADMSFDALAPHVPSKDRVDVWMACDSFASQAL